MSSGQPNGSSGNLQGKLEFWVAVLIASEPVASEADLDEALFVAHHFVAVKCPPRQSCLAYSIHGKVVLLRRSRYPEWQRWVPCSAVFALEAAFSLHDDTLTRLCASLLEQYARCVFNNG